MLPLQYRDLFSFGGLGLRVRALKKGLMIQATWLRVKLLTAVVMLAAGWTDSATGPQPRSHLECCSATQDVKLQPLPPKCAATLEAVLHPVHANSGRQPEPDTKHPALGPCTFTIAPGLANSGIGPALGADLNLGHAHEASPAVVPALYLSLDMEVTGPKVCDGSYVTLTVRAGAMRPSSSPGPFYHHRFAFWPTRRADLRGDFDGSRYAIAHRAAAPAIPSTPTIPTPTIP